MDNLLTAIFFTFGVLLIISGLIIFFAPKFLIRISEPLNKELGLKRKSKILILSDEKVFLNRHFFGPVLVIIGLILLYFSFYIL